MLSMRCVRWTAFDTVDLEWTPFLVVREILAYRFSKRSYSRLPSVLNRYHGFSGIPDRGGAAGHHNYIVVHLPVVSTSKARHQGRKIDQFSPRIQW